MLPLSTAAPVLPLTTNPCTIAAHDPAVDLTAIDVPAVFARPPHLRPPRRLIRDLRACKSAAEALAGLDHATELYAFTKGRFSLLDLLRACLAITGPAELYLSTWSAEPRDVTCALEFLDAGLITRARWLIDPSLQRRAPGLTQKLRDLFGADAIRMGANHSKFAVLIPTSGAWRVESGEKPTRRVSDDPRRVRNVADAASVPIPPGPPIVIRTSANIEQLRANEQYTIAHDAPLAAFLVDFLDALWRPRPALALTDYEPLAVESDEPPMERADRSDPKADPPAIPNSQFAICNLQSPPAPAPTREARRRAAAAAAIRDLSPTTDLYGFTAGRFSFIDLIDAALSRVEPAALTIASWTLQTNDLATVARWQRHGRITAAKFLIDKSIASRPGAAGVLPFIREHFTAAAIALDNNHGKWAVVSSGESRVASADPLAPSGERADVRGAGGPPPPIVIHTSANLNYNPRFEDFTIAHDAALAVFLTTIVNSVHHSQNPSPIK